MLENLLKRYDNFGNQQNIAKILSSLEQSKSLPVSNLRTINIPQSTIDLLQCLAIIKEHKGRVSLVGKHAPLKMPLLIYQSLFQKLKEERLLHAFLHNRNIHQEQSRIFIKNNVIPLKFSALRNLLIDFSLFVQDELISSQFYIYPDYQEWFCENVIPDIEASKLADNPLSRLINRRNQQEEIGKQAEEFVLEYERRQRKNHVKTGNIKIISELDTSAGYDIMSYMDDDSLLLDKFIEVKSYKGDAYFYWSDNEVKIAEVKHNQYYLYLVDRDFMGDKDYHPIQIENPASCLFSDDDWLCRNDGYFFEKKKKEE